jgi:hypothetical protein
VRKDDTELLANGASKIQDFKMPPSSLFPDVLVAHNKTTPELIEMIKREKMKGNSNVLDAKKQLNAYFVFYILNRPHSSVDKMTPDDFYYVQLPQQNKVA